MTKRRHKDWLAAFVKYASFGEAPLRMYWWVGVSTIAGALRRRVWIDQKHFQWVPNFYIILVAPPGVVSKSTTAGIGMDLLKKIKGINFGPNICTWQKIIEDMGKANEMVLDKETGVYLPMSCVTIASSELGTFLNPQNKEMVDALVELWDGKAGAFKKATKSSGSDSIENPWINMIACTTPSWIADNFPDYMIGGGFTSRTVFLYADKKRKYVPYVDEAVPPEFLAMQDDLLHDLELISQMVGEYEIDDDAREWGRIWYMNHNTVEHNNLPSDQFGGYLARKQTHIHKLAMILAASESDHRLIERSHLERAAEMVDVLEADMPRVFDKIGRTQQTALISELSNTVARHKKLSMKELYLIMSRKCTLEEFRKLVESAVMAGLINQHADNNQLIYTRGEKYVQ